MGNRVSISFVRGEEESVALFSHWDGMGFVKSARKFAKKLSVEIGNNTTTPLERLRPETVMLEFIREYITERVSSNYYLGKDGSDGDNSDNGHYKIKLVKQ